MATTSLGWDNFYSTTLAASISASDTTVTVVAAPTATEGFLTIEPDSSTNREIIYYTNVVGTSLTLPSVGAGRGVGGTTARAHSSGVVVKMNTVAEMFEALQDMTAVTDGTVLPRHLLASAGTSWTWQNFTPAFTNWTIGTGGSAVTTAKWTKVGKLIIFRITTILGSSGQSVGAGVSFNLPATAVTGMLGAGTFFPIGQVQIEDAGNASYFGTIRMNSTTTAQVLVDAAGATYRQPTALSSTVPFTFAAGDGMTILGMYEAA